MAARWGLAFTSDRISIIPTMTSSGWNDCFKDGGLQFNASVSRMDCLQILALRQRFSNFFAMESIHITCYIIKSLFKNTYFTEIFTNIFALDFTKILRNPKL